MLTKAHLKYQTRNGVVFPKYIPNDDETTLIKLEKLISIYRDSIASPLMRCKKNCSVPD